MLNFRLWYASYNQQELCTFMWIAIPWNGTNTKLNKNVPNSTFVIQCVKQYSIQQVTTEPHWLILLCLSGVAGKTYPPANFKWSYNPTKVYLGYIWHVVLNVLIWQSQKLSQTKIPIICPFSIYLKPKQMNNFGNIFTLYNIGNLTCVSIMVMDWYAHQP